MKKNILTIIILAVSLANLVMTAVMLFVVVPSAKNTNKLVYKVAEAIDLELKTNGKELSIYDQETYVFNEKTVTINLKKGEKDTADSYAAINGISLMLNKTAEDYSSASQKIITNEIKILDIISSEYSKYTKTEAQEKKDDIKAAILLDIADEFETKIVVDISFGSVAFQ
ncbi:MAG: hypothetical protein K6G26_01710 [Lachnospiraceae bacterium]|nr:hypothetical protein [Lachnospiraceae bacterium]